MPPLVTFLGLLMERWSMPRDNSRFRGPDIVLKKRQAVGHGECQGCGHLVTWYDMLPDEDYSNCVICSGFLIVTRTKQRQVDPEDDE